MTKIRRFLRGKGSSIAYTIISIIFTIVPEDIFKCIKICNKWSDQKNILINRLIFCSVVIILSNIIYFFYKKNRKEVSVKRDDHTIMIEYGDLLQISSGKVIINFDECFTTKVGDAPGEIKEESICGQYLQAHPIEDIQKLIDNADVKPAKGKSRYKNQTRYNPGTVVPNGKYLLMAFAKLNENGRGNLTYDEYLDCLDKLWTQIDIYHGTDDVYIPILGSRITYFEKDFTQQELLDIMINSYFLSPNKIKEPNKLHIICRKRENFSINNAFGVD